MKSENAGVLVSEALAAQASHAASKGIRIRSIDELLGANLWCDREDIARVFADILGCAIEVCVAGDEIVIRAIAGETEARFAISDPGPGLAPAVKSSRGIIDAHAGSLWIETSAGDGTTVFFTVPLSR